MTRSRKRPTPLSVCPLEPRQLLDADPTGTWLGQDRNDLVGPSPVVAPSDVQDIHIALAGLPAGRGVTSAVVQGFGGGEWHYRGPWGPWAAEIVRDPGSTSADLFIEPYQVETSRPFHVELRYDDGTSAGLWLTGGAADPNLRMPEAAVRVEWLGQDGRDHVGPGPSVGPDGLVDVHLVLSNLSAAVPIESVTLTGPDGLAWKSGTNREALSNAELVRRGDDPSMADLFLQADRDLTGVSLALEVVYGNGKSDATTFVAGQVDPGLRVPAPSPPPPAIGGVTAQWVGQDGLDLTGQGDVHLAVAGLPAGRVVIGASLSNQANALWAYRDGRFPYHADPFAAPLGFRRASDPTRADLSFPPARDESGAALTLRLAFDDGTMAVVPIAGGGADLGRRANGPAATRVVAQPGDDLHALVNQFGNVRLSAGVYDLNRPLVLDQPVSITADPGAVLRFSQPAGSPTWTTAIKVHYSHTTLDGFAVRFAGPIRWDHGVGYGPAVIGTTDDRDAVPSDLKTNLAFTRLDLEGPPAATSWEEAIRLFRLVSAQNGRIEGNILKGGAIEFFGGPWRVVGNDYRGALPNTYAYSVISTHFTHDLLVQGNTARPVGPSGKTWRFLVMTGTGTGDLVRDNTIVGVGPRDDDLVTDNAPEIVLTEAYSLHFEGKPRAISPDGRIVQIPSPQGEPARTGSVVAILSGPGAGQWRRIAQAIDPTTYLLESPLPAGDYAISIASGFVGETYEGNTIDARGSSVAVDLFLAGNHFGTRVVGNHLLGGGGAFRITAAPSESPVHWGWSHAPVLGLVVEGNRLEDVVLGATLEVEHGPPIKSNQGRVYFSGVVNDTTFRWTESFLAGRAEPPAITVGDLGSLDPGELVLSMAGNRLDVPVGYVPGNALWVHAGTVNGVALVDQRLPLPTLTAVASPTGLGLVRDTGSNPGDQITRDGRVWFDAVLGAVGYEYRLGASGPFLAGASTSGFLPTGLAQGLNTVAIRAFDSAGARGPETSLSFTLDTVAPGNTPPSLSPASDTGRSNADLNTADRLPEFLADGEATDTLILTRNGTEIGRRVGPGELRPSAGVIEGLGLFAVRRVDLAGNASTSPWVAVTIDATPPPAVGGLSAGLDGRVHFAATTPNDHYEYRVGDATTFVPIGTATTFAPSGLTGGANIVQVRAVDPAGNAGPVAAVVMIVPALESGIWLGQNGPDLVGPSPLVLPDGVPDIHIALAGLNAARAIVYAEVQGLGGGLWLYRGAWGPWAAEIVRAPGSTTADLYVQPYQRESGRPFLIRLRYDDGGTAEFWVAGGAADPSLRVSSGRGFAAPSTSGPAAGQTRRHRRAPVRRVIAPNWRRPFPRPGQRPGRG